MNLFRSSITRKVQIIFLLFAAGVLLLSFTTTIIGANYLLRDTTIDYTYQLVGEVDSSVRDYQKDMENMVEAILERDEVQVYLGGNQSYEKASVEALEFAADTRNDITNIFLLVFEDDGSAKLISDEGTNTINPYARYANADWFRQIVENGEEKVHTSSYVQNLIVEEYHWVISLAQAVTDEEDQLMGIVLIDLNYSSIEGILSNVMPEEQGYIYLMTEDEEVVYHPFQQRIFNKVRVEDTESIRGISNSHRQIGDKVYVVVESGVAGWKTVAVLDSTVVYRNTIINSIIFLSIGVIAIILSFYFSRYFSGWITKPIKRLAGQMEKVQAGDLSVQVAVNSDDEIGHLSESFNIMTTRIKSLVERILIEQEEKRQYELNALRSQINPHFLYNTLDSIIWMSECGRNEEAIEMTSALSKMLRTSITHQKSGVTLGLEVQNVVNYLKIQKYRYSNKLDYSVEVDQSLYEKKAAHLVLQPLVENAIYHGVKAKDGTGKIIIRAYEEGEGTKELIIQVIDDGVGMSEEEISQVLKKEGKNPYGIGVMNVNRRIALIYGDDYGLSIESELNEGTTVTIRIPSQTMDEEGDDIYENRHV